METNEFVELVVSDSQSLTTRIFNSSSWLLAALVEENKQRSRTSDLSMPIHTRPIISQTVELEILWLEVPLDTVDFARQGCCRNQPAAISYDAIVQSLE